MLHVHSCCYFHYYYYYYYYYYYKSNVFIFVANTKSSGFRSYASPKHSHLLAEVHFIVGFELVRVNTTLMDVKFIGL